MSQAKIAFLSFATTLGLVGAGAIIYTFNKDQIEDKLLVACESEIKLRLVAPSTFKAISVTKTETNVPGTEFKRRVIEHDGLCSEACQILLKNFDEEKISPKIYVYNITYDANNSYNAPIRNRDECEYFSHDGNPMIILDVNIKINGKSRADEYREERRKQKQLKIKN